MAGTRGRGVLRYGAAFAFLILAGFVIWFLSTPSVAVILFGNAGYEAAYESPLYGFLGLPLLALPPLIAGFVMPKGFFLWGAATVLPYLPGAVWTYLRAGAENTFLTPEPGAAQILSLALVEIVILLFLTLACTLGSGLGAGARALLHWRRASQRGGSVGSERGA